jgi:hypothetical protein
VGSGDAGTVFPIQNDGDGRRYLCTVAFQSSGGAFDCTKGPHAGLQGTIVSLGLSADYCTGRRFGAIGTSIDGVATPTTEVCAYECDIVR